MTITIPLVPTVLALMALLLGFFNAGLFTWMVNISNHNRLQFWIGYAIIGVFVFVLGIITYGMIASPDLKLKYLILMSLLLVVYCATAFIIVTKMI